MRHQFQRKKNEDCDTELRKKNAQEYVDFIRRIKLLYPLCKFGTII